MPQISLARDTRGARLRYEGVELPCLYVNEMGMSSSFVTVFRNVLTDDEAAVFNQEQAWDLIHIKKEDIEKECVFPSDDAAIYGFRTFLWRCPDGVTVTVRPDTFRHVLEHFNLNVFRDFSFEHVVSQSPFVTGAVQEMDYYGIRLFIDGRHIFVYKLDDWRGKKGEAKPKSVRARYDFLNRVILLHEDWSVERVAKKR